MVSFFKDVDWLRVDLRFFSMMDCLCWVDVIVLGDGCVFVLCDLVVVSGVVMD